MTLNQTHKLNLPQQNPPHPQLLPIQPQFTAKTAQICAKLHIPDFAPENDAWIASSALEHHLILVTHNVQDFARTGVKLFNPFEYVA